MRLLRTCKMHVLATAHIIYRTAVMGEALDEKSLAERQWELFRT